MRPLVFVAILEVKIFQSFRITGVYCATVHRNIVRSLREELILFFFATLSFVLLYCLYKLLSLEYF